MRKRIEEKIREVVERMGNLTYVFEDLKGANLKLDSAELPAFVNVLPISGSINIKTDMIRHIADCSFWFVDKIRMDVNGDDIQHVVNRCMDYAYEFLLTLNESKHFYPIENTDVTFQVATGDFDANVSGVVLTLRLKEREGLALCGKPIKDYFDDEEGRCGEGCL